LAWQERTSAYTLHTWCATKVSSKRGAFGSNRSQTQVTPTWVRPTQHLHHFEVMPPRLASGRGLVWCPDWFQEPVWEAVWRLLPRHPPRPLPRSGLGGCLGSSPRQLPRPLPQTPPGRVWGSGLGAVWEQVSRNLLQTAPGRPNHPIYPIPGNRVFWDVP